MSRHADPGFTLIEVLVALLILSVSLVTLFAGLGHAWRGNAATARRLADMQQIRSRMEALGVTEPLQSGISSGNLADSAKWVQMVIPYEGNADTGTIRGFWVSIQVERPERNGKPVNSFGLVTLKLVSLAPP